MQFGLFGGARTKRSVGLEDSQGYESFIDYVIEADRLGFRQLFMVEHHFTGQGQVSASMTVLAYLAATHPAHPPRHRGGRAALAQSGADRRAGRHARPAERRPVRFRRRQGLPPGRVRRLLHSRSPRPPSASTRRWRSSARRGPAKAGSAITASAGTTTTSWSSPSRCSARTRRSGWPPAAPTASAAPRARATICCSTSSPRSTRSSSASRIFREECETDRPRLRSQHGGDRARRCR